MKPRVGLLACDSIWEPLRSAHGDYADMYGALLRAAGADVDLQTYAAHRGELPDSVSDCAAWLISGSRAAVYDESLPWVAGLAQFARAAHAAGRPQVGICFGHQLLAHALGGRTEPASAGWGIGNIDVHLRATPYGAPPRTTLKLFMAHQDQVTRLPPGALWLAEAAHCPHAAFALDDCVLGIQPHPEFTAAFMRDMTPGIVGGIVAPWVFRALRITDGRIQGLVLGVVAHAVGTARAIEMGHKPGAFAGVGLALTGLLTALLLPLLVALLG